MRITIDKSKCIAAGQCVLKAPLIFDQSEDDGVVILLNDSPTGDLQLSAQLAAKLCPARVIVLTD